ncbi:MAG: radical SAM family heme chaperone HemW [Acidimicrobiia bacterium]|nr:radical SAM family heme chaperone HemW [Acidimicrobiia bacterium]
MIDQDRPDTPAMNDAARALRGAYVHIPFCGKVCPYCDFAVVEGAQDQFSRYISALEREISLEPPWGPLDAVHFGGGTPSVLAADVLGGVLGAISDEFGLAAGAEVALEANPEDWSPGYAQALTAAGFERVSFGVQSSDPEVLAALGRRHSPSDSLEAVAAARDAGFRSINVDLIYGTPGESLQSWQRSVATALEAEPDHLSTYALTVERGTPLSAAIANGAPSPDADLQADMYESVCEAAEGAGLVRYEVSNFARPGHASRYNLLTWAQGEYLGFGTGAHDHRSGRRTRNIRRLDAYLDKVESGTRPIAGDEEGGEWDSEVERLFLGLRRVSGVESGAGGEALMMSEWGKRLAAAGVLDRSGDRIRVARPLHTDEASRAVLALSQPDC